MIPRVRTALDIKNVLDHWRGITYPAFAFDATTIQTEKRDLLRRFPDLRRPQKNACRESSPSETSDVEDGGESEDSLDPSAKNVSDTFKIMDSVDKKLLAHATKLGKIANKCITHASGYAGFDYWPEDAIQIKRRGCKYSGPTLSEDYRHKPDGPDLALMFKYATVSGFGNVRTQETEYDPGVRSAREIPASDFYISPEVLHEVETLWKKKFLPSEVRVEPYKIHIYGAGGKFDSHKDTPERDLVGTFLLGLGDTSQPKERFEIAGKSFNANFGSWVAFYPDTPHAVKAIKEGHRAVIAFKLFRRHDNPEASADNENSLNGPLADIKEAVKSDFSQMPPPFAFGLRHQYHVGITEPSGFDMMLLEVARERADVEIHLLPVVSKISLSANEEEVESNSVEASIYPLTNAHLDFALGDVEALQRDPSIQWLQSLKEKIPYVHVDLGIRWSNDRVEGPDYLGNESRSWDEYSIYLQYAMVVLPKPDPPREPRRSSRIKGSTKSKTASTSKKADIDKAKAPAPQPRRTTKRKRT
ncbi:unnamed protein product [Somion occarium]|uniref:Fe2OG dioxygenase domain-containing protein n=1 Tax=Somion occarium TaxID=3059160 RepID=A0ABP1E874_9APHY